MKISFNQTTSRFDLERFESREDMLEYMAGFDGLEVMCLDDDERGIIPPGRVAGLHMSFFPYWLDFYYGDRAALIKEFGSEERCFEEYGGDDVDAMLARFRRDIADAERLGASYVVFHVSDASIEELITGRFRHTDEEVVDVTAEILNELTRDWVNYQPELLLENLWYCGLTFTRPEITRRLLNSVKYKKTGLMLDTGHLMHTNPAIVTQRDAADYINKMLDEHGELCSRIRGVHLNRSLSGEFLRSTHRNPPLLADDYDARASQLYTYLFELDRHEPFDTPEAARLVRRISPEYLTFEFITRDRAEHREYLERQLAALNRNTE